MVQDDHDRHISILAEEVDAVSLKINKHKEAGRAGTIRGKKSLRGERQDKSRYNTMKRIYEELQPRETKRTYFYASARFKRVTIRFRSMGYEIRVR